MQACQRMWCVFLLSDCAPRVPPHRGWMTYWLKGLIYSDEASGEAPGLVLVMKSTPSLLTLAPPQTHAHMAQQPLWKLSDTLFGRTHSAEILHRLSIPLWTAAVVLSRQAHQADFGAWTESDLITAAMQNEYHPEFETSKDSVFS